MLGLVVVLLFFREHKPFASQQWWWLWLVFFLVTSSHGILDALTDGGLGLTQPEMTAPWLPAGAAAEGMIVINCAGRGYNAAAPGVLFLIW